MHSIAARRRKVALALHVVSLLLFLASLTQPAYEALTHNGPSVGYGIFALLLGIIGHKAWFANPLLALAWVSLHQWSGYLSAFFAAAGLGVALMFLAPEQVVPVGSMGMYPYRPLLGFYLWVSSLGFAITSGLAAGRAVGQRTAAPSDA